METQDKIFKSRDTTLEEVIIVLKELIAKTERKIENIENHKAQ